MQSNAFIMVFLLPFVMASLHNSLRQKSDPHRFSTNTSFKNGLIIKEIGNGKIIDGAYSVFITLERPQLAEIETWLANITKTINMRSPEKWPVGLMESWKNRILNIKQKANKYYFGNTRKGKRKRRAIFSSIGEVSRLLFGTATEESVSNIKRHLSRAVDNQETLYHNQESLITVVNKSREAITNISKHLSDITDEAINKITLKEDMLEHLNMELTERVNFMAASMVINNDLLSMEQLLHEFELKNYRFNQIKQSLNEGRMSKIILSENNLQEIFKEMSKARMSPPSMNWVYDHALVHLVSHNEYFSPQRNENTFVFALLIPSTRNIDFTLYEFTTFYTPVPNVTSTSIIQKLIVQKQIATDYKGIYSFQVNDGLCKGHPIICAPTILETEETCETALIHKTPTSKCILKIKERKEKKTDIVMLQKDQALISPLVNKVNIVTDCQTYRPQIRRPQNHKMKKVLKYYTKTIHEVYIQVMQEDCTYTVEGHE